MNIIVGKNSGFCKGVENTVEKAKEELEKKDIVYCIGDIVHNEKVVETLRQKGLIKVNTIEEVKDHAKLIIRAHGEKKEIYEKAKDKNIKIIDLTCGKIKATKKKIENHKKDSFIIIIGKKNHPESQGIKSFAKENSFIIEEKKDIEEFLSLYKNSFLKKIYIVSQTTFNSEKFDQLVNILKGKIQDEIFIDKTICDVTNKRQQEVEELSKIVDKMIIIGGKNSSNTKELAEIAKKNCKTILVQGKENLSLEEFNLEETIGIMAGASTPHEVIEEIINVLKYTKV